MAKGLRRVNNNRFRPENDSHDDTRWGISYSHSVRTTQIDIGIYMYNILIYIPLNAFTMKTIQRWMWFSIIVRNEVFGRACCHAENLCDIRLGQNVRGPMATMLWMNKIENPMILYANAHSTFNQLLVHTRNYFRCRNTAEQRQSTDGVFLYFAW